MTLAREKSQAGRNSLFDTVQELFVKNDGNLTDRERALMGEILRQLIHDVALSVRKDVAKRLSDRNDAPRELVLALAIDDIEVPLPLSLNSSVLHDVDLIEIIKHRTQAPQLAVSMCKNVSEAVSDALVETGDTGVIASLLENVSAAISRASIEYIVAESKRIDTFQYPPISRRTSTTRGRTGCAGRAKPPRRAAAPPANSHNWRHRPTMRSRPPWDSWYSAAHAGRSAADPCGSWRHFRPRRRALDLTQINRRSPPEPSVHAVFEQGVDVAVPGAVVGVEQALGRGEAPGNYFIDGIEVMGLVEAVAAENGAARQPLV